MTELRGFQIYGDLRGEEGREHHGLEQQNSGEENLLLFGIIPNAAFVDEGFVTVPTTEDDFIRVEREGGNEGEEEGEDEQEEVDVNEVSWTTAVEPDEEERESSNSSSDEVRALVVLC